MLGIVHRWFPQQVDRGRTDTILFRLAWLLHIPLPFFLIYAISNGPDWRNVIGNVLAILASFAPRWIEARSRHRFPALGEFAIALTLLVELLGRTFHLYERIPVYDTFAHAVEVGALTTFAVLLLYAFFLEYNVGYDGWFIWLAGLTVGLAIGGAWEIFEWIIDLLFQAGYQAGLQDTMVDLSAGAIGAVVGTFGARAYRANHSDEEVLEELPIFYEWL